MNPQYQQLIEYIKSHVANGTSAESLKPKLLEVGWDSALVDKAIAEVGAVANPAVQEPLPPTAQPAIQPVEPVQQTPAAQAVNQTTPPVQLATQQPAQPAYGGFNQTVGLSNVKSSPINRKKLLFIGLSFLVVIILAAVSYWLFFKPKTPEQVFDRLQTENMKASTFVQKFTTDSKEDGAKVVAVAKTDFSDPKEPKTDTELTMDITDPTGDISIAIHVIQISDTTYLSYEKADYQSDDPAYKQYIKESGGFYKLLGIEKLNSWIKLDSNNPIKSPDPNDVLSIGSAASSLTTVLGTMPMGNFGDKAKDFKAAIQEAYTLDYDQVVKEDLSGKKAMKFKLKTNTDKIKEVNEKYGMELDLSAREIDLIKDPNNPKPPDEYTIWVDTKTYHPLKVEAEDILIEFSDFGQKFDIKAPI